jgi:hypothetical protein
MNPRTLIHLASATISTAVLLCVLAGCGIPSTVLDWWHILPPASTVPAPPAPDDSPTLPPENPPVATDAVAVDGVMFDEPASPAAWPITAKITGARITVDGIAVESITGTEDWPLRQDGGVKTTAGNWVLIARCADGRWHGAAVEWYGPGKRLVTGKRWDGTDAIHGCLGSDYRGTGEAYVLVSGCIRAGADCGRERTGIVGVQ